MDIGYSAMLIVLVKLGGDTEGGVWTMGLCNVVLDCNCVLDWSDREYKLYGVMVFLLGVGEGLG